MQLNLEQKKLILMEPSGHILIKGVAGSGKIYGCCAPDVLSYEALLS